MDTEWPNKRSNYLIITMYICCFRLFKRTLTGKCFEFYHFIPNQSLTSRIRSDVNVLQTATLVSMNVQD